MYNEINCIDTSFHKYDYKNKEMTMQECIDRILEGLEIYIKNEVNSLSTEENDWNKIQDAFRLFGIILRDLWW